MNPPDDDAPRVDDEVRVIALPREYRYWLTPEGETALDRAREASKIITRMTHGEAEPTMAIPRSVCDQARHLARQRRSTQIPEPRRPLI
jgi:hypothetical protein